MGNTSQPPGPNNVALGAGALEMGCGEHTRIGPQAPSHISMEWTRQPPATAWLRPSPVQNCIAGALRPQPRCSKCWPECHIRDPRQAHDPALHDLRHSTLARLAQPFQPAA